MAGIVDEPVLNSERSGGLSEKMLKKIGPGDKTSHEGKPVFRADAIPDFVTPDWVEKNFRLTDVTCPP